MENRNASHGHENQGFVNELSVDNNKINETIEDRSPTGSTKVAVSIPVIKRTNSSTKNNEDEVDLSCGIWKLRTNVFGKMFANLYVFSIFVGLTACFTNMMQSLFQTHLTSFQRQFGIDNTKTGLFETASKIGVAVTVLFAGHFAKKIHIPVLVGVAGALQGIILMVPAFLQFAQPYTLPNVDDKGGSSNSTNNDNDNYVCLLENTTRSVHGPISTQTKDTNQIAFIVIIVVQVLKGITDSFHAGFLPSLYMDDNMLDKTAMGLILGLNSVIGDIGQPIGKQINALLTKVPIDLKETTLSPKDGRFVAAWWLAFLIFGAGTFVFSIPVMLFPRKLISQRQQEESLRKAVISFTTGEEVRDEDLIKVASIKEAKKAPIKRENSPRPDKLFEKLSLGPRLSNNSVVLDTTSHYTRRSSLLPPIEGPTERRVSIDGTMIFDQPIKSPIQEGEPIQGSAKAKDLLRDFPRAFLRIFRRPVFILILVDILVASIPMFGIALFRSMYVTYEYNVPMADVATLSAWTMITGQIIGTVISGLLAKRVKTKMGYNYIIVCCYMVAMCITPLFIVFGCDNEKIYGFDGENGMHLNTSETCHCAGTKDLLACGEDGNNYLSPCYAGCLNYTHNLFTNCSGFNDSFSNMTMNTGLCETDCYTNYLLYIILHAVQMMVMSMCTIPRRLIIMRMVDPQDRGFASSVFMFFSIIVAIPSPNIFGKAIDSTCLIWNGHECILYDRNKIRYLLSGIDVGVSGTVQITIILIIYFFRKEEIELRKKLQQEGKVEDKTTTNVKL